jgi:hypothetical protein
MTTEKCILVLPSSVYVSARRTVLTDPREREKQYLDAIGFFIRESPVGKIVVGDNSGYRYRDSLIDLARSYGKELELHCFQGDKGMVAKCGKGYGEGEIMEYLFSNSRLLRQATGFLKVTGRLRLTNIDKMLPSIDEEENYFMPVYLDRWLAPRNARQCVELRTYYATTAFFGRVLLHAYKDTMDDAVYFLEHAYYAAIAKSGARTRHFKVLPEIVGMSGSNGWSFRERNALQKLMTRLILLTR